MSSFGLLSRGLFGVVHSTRFVLCSRGRVQLFGVILSRPNFCFNRFFPVAAWQLSQPSYQVHSVIQCARARAPEVDTIHAF